jgi:hypothetical protein
MQNWNKNDMQDNNKIKIKYVANLKGQDDTHVGATSPSLGVCTNWWWRFLASNPSTSSPVMVPENPLMLPLGWDSKSRVLSIRKLDFPHEDDSRVYIELSGNCVYKDRSCPSSNNLQGKINLLCALNLTKWLSSTRCVLVYKTINKYVNATALENILPREYAS